jgi:DNA/RNA-binding domain of Phe-tRNA-synthetase-like protein
MSDKLIFSDAVRSQCIPLRIALVEFSNLAIYKSSTELDIEFDKAVKEILDGFSLESLSSDKAVRNVRDLFKKFGVDPTKWRPSSEAMIRRILKDKGLFRINSLVDINNIVSIRYRLPIGLYDMDKVDGMLTVDIGREGDMFTGLTGREYNAGEKPVVMDSRGIIGSPIVDSDRSKITLETSKALAVIFTNQEEQFEHSLDAGKEFARLVKRYHPDSAVSKPFQIE